MCREGCLLGDNDDDGDLDLRDIARLQQCYSRPFDRLGYDAPSPACSLHFDFDEDDDIDLDDFVAWRQVYDGR